MVMILDIKKMDFAGSWYPATAVECEKKIDQFTKTSDFMMLSEKEYSACISPHAGWYFSGKIACNVIKLLKSEKPVDVVVLFGKHLHALSPATILTNCLLETPFGNLAVDNDFCEELVKRLEFNTETASSLMPDNTIELQLPFIKYFFGNTKIVVIGAPLRKFSMEIGETVSLVAREMGLAIKIIGSTDMTHYGDNFGFTPAGFGSEAVEWVKHKNDQRMIEVMLSMNGNAVLKQASENFNACCGGAVAATVTAAKELGCLNGQVVAYSSSYDLSPGDSFVGYGGVVY